jgi:HD-GYP domain-containing protein (c-di-GMP phosphodiesterase class II)
MRQHPVVGERIIVRTPGLAPVAPPMRAEHERWDGAGYPDARGRTNSVGEPHHARATHAMTSDRPYRQGMTAERAEQELRSCSGSQFEPRVIGALLAQVAAPSATAAG